LGKANIRIRLTANPKAFKKKPPSAKFDSRGRCFLHPNDGSGGALQFLQPVF
jgi:hypothetical protein